MRSKTRSRLILGGFHAAPLCLSLFVSACGAESSGYTPTRDTIETSASISFDPAERTIDIVSAAASARSAILSPCEISIEATLLSYQLIDADTLVINGGTYKKSGELLKPEAVAGVPSGVFALWSGEARVIDQVQNQIDIEIHADKLYYRNNCSR